MDEPFIVRKYDVLLHTPTKVSALWWKETEQICFQMRENKYKHTYI